MKKIWKKMFLAIAFSASFCCAIAIFIPRQAECVTDQMDLFYPFELSVHSKLIDLTSDTIKVVLSNTAPTMSWSQLSSVTQIASGNGYTTGGAAVTITSLTQSSGVVSWVLGSTVTWTASGGSMAEARYAILYDDTATNDLLIGVLDYGTAFTLESGQSFSIPFTGVTMLTVE